MCRAKTKKNKAIEVAWMGGAHQQVFLVNERMQGALPEPSRGK
jgi:hypothetical protein